MSKVALLDWNVMLKIQFNIKQCVSVILWVFYFICRLLGQSVEVVAMHGGLWLNRK